MVHQLFQFLFILGFCIIYSYQWDTVLNLDESDQLLCYSCKGKECETIDHEETNTIVCNKQTQLCWAGYVDHQPYRACASRHCTPTNFSLGSHMRIETCCRANLCNSDALLPRPRRKSLRKTTTMPTTQTSSFIESEIIEDELDRKEEYNEILNDPQLNTSDPKSFGISWDRIPYNGISNDRISSMSCTLLMLVLIYYFSYYN